MTSVNATPMTIVGVIVIRFLDLDAILVFRGDHGRLRREIEITVRLCERR
jgi:hypothetical protein